MRPIRTQVGRADWGGNRFRGASVEEELAGKVSHAQASILAITGRLPSPADAALIDDLNACMLVADPRIWPCKIARLGASRGSALTGLAVSLLAQESDAVGGWSSVHAATYFVSLRTALGESPSDDAVRERVAADVEGGARFFGYGVPFRPVDERVVAARRCIAARGCADRPFIRLAEQVGRILEEKKPLPLNVGGAYAAVLLDLGFTPDEIRLVITIGTELPLLANAVEGAEQKAPVLQRLPDECIEYKGPPPRRSPRFSAGK